MSPVFADLFLKFGDGRSLFLLFGFFHFAQLIIALLDFLIMVVIFALEDYK